MSFKSHLRATLQQRFEQSHNELRERLKYMYPEDKTKVRNFGEIKTFNVQEDKPKEEIKGFNSKDFEVVHPPMSLREIDQCIDDLEHSGIHNYIFSDAILEKKEPYTTEAHFTPGNPALTGECFKSKDDPRNKAKRYNSGKPQLSLTLSTGVALDGVANVMEFGAKKYDRDNWKKGLNPTSILDSLIRHCRRYLDGEYIDKDSGLPHIDHIACNALFLGYHTNRETQDGMKNV